MTERGLTTRVLESPELHLPPWRLPYVRHGTFIFEKAVDLAHGSSAEKAMSTIPPDSELGSSSAPPSVYSRTKSQRTLACVLCQQRKVKCDRKFPCSNCLKFKAECIPAALNPRQRKRRFPERDLLERIRKYEDLLRQNKITFEPLHKSTTGSKRPLVAAVDHDSDGEQPDSMSMDQSSPSTSENPKEIREAKYGQSSWNSLCM